MSKCFIFGLRSHSSYVHVDNIVLHSNEPNQMTCFSQLLKIQKFLSTANKTDRMASHQIQNQETCLPISSPQGRVFFQQHIFWYFHWWISSSYPAAGDKIKNEAQIPFRIKPHPSSGPKKRLVAATVCVDAGLEPSFIHGACLDPEFTCLLFKDLKEFLLICQHSRTFKNDFEIDLINLWVFLGLLSFCFLN